MNEQRGVLLNTEGYLQNRRGPISNINQNLMLVPMEGPLSANVPHT